MVMMQGDGSPQTVHTAKHTVLTEIAERLLRTQGDSNTSGKHNVCFQGQRSESRSPEPLPINTV